MIVPFVTDSISRTEARATRRRPLRRAQGVAGPSRQAGGHRPPVPISLRSLPEGPRVPHHRPQRSHHHHPPGAQEPKRHRI